MSKGLGQLQFLRRNYCVLKRERECACDIIEKELKEGEKDHELKVEICEYFGLDNLFPYNDNSKIMEKLKETQGHYYDIQFKKSKKEKALDIIRDKRVNADYFIYTCVKNNWSYEDYLDEISNSDNLALCGQYCFSNKQPILTQEEYDLLKEVLINEKETS